MLDGVDEVQMATDEISPEKARARLQQRMKRDAKQPDVTQAMAREYASFKSWVADIKDMVRVSKKPAPKPTVGTAADRRRPMLRANAFAHRELQEQTTRLEVIDTNHINVPMVAINRAATVEELLAISWHIQGFLLTTRDVGKSQFAQGARGVVLEMNSDARGSLIAMYGYVNQKLAAELRKLADIAIEQTLMLTEVPVSFNQIGEEISKSQDERVQKGAVVGYYRAMFQSVRHYQREYHIMRATRAIADRRTQSQ